MQLLVFESDRKLAPAACAEESRRALTRRNVPSVVYEDLNNPHGLVFLSWSEEPLDFANKTAARIR